jgi:hypothetical protein
MMVEIAGAIFGALIFFRVRKAYKHLTGSSPVHPVFKWIWATSCQMKHTVFLAPDQEQIKYEEYAQEKKYAT